MRFDMRFGALVSEWHASCGADESEGRSICEARFHRGIPLRSDVPHFSRLIWPPTLVGSVPAVGRVGDAEQVEDLPL